MPDGRMEQRQIDLLKQMGNWLEVYGASIYKTNGGPYFPNNVYSATRKDSTIYVHVFDAAKTELNLPTLDGIKILNLSWMNGSPAEWKEVDRQIQVKIPAKLPENLSNVLVLQIDKPVMNIPIQRATSE